MCLSRLTRGIYLWFVLNWHFSYLSNISVIQHFPDIPQLEGLLFDVDAALGAIESHGVLCGMLCAQGATEASQWMLHVLGEHEETSKALQSAGKSLLQAIQVGGIITEAGCAGLNLLHRNNCFHFLLNYLVFLTLGRYDVTYRI